MLLRLQPDCNSSDPPCLAYPARVRWVVPVLKGLVLTDWSAFVRLSNERQAPAEGLGWRR